MLHLLIATSVAASVHQPVMQTHLAQPSEFEAYTVQFSKTYGSAVRNASPKKIVILPSKRKLLRVSQRLALLDPAACRIL